MLAIIARMMLYKETYLADILLASQLAKIQKIKKKKNVTDDRTI